MELVEYMEKIASLEEQVLLCKDLLAVTKSYCDCNFDKAEELLTTSSILNLILKEHDDILGVIDSIQCQDYLCKQ